jgi:hypothetical protein
MTTTAGRAENAWRGAGGTNLRAVASALSSIRLWIRRKNACVIPASHRILRGRRPRCFARRGVRPARAQARNPHALTANLGSRFISRSFAFLAIFASWRQGRCRSAHRACGDRQSAKTPRAPRPQRSKGDSCRKTIPCLPVLSLRSWRSSRLCAQAEVARRSRRGWPTERKDTESAKAAKEERGFVSGDFPVPANPLFALLAISASLRPGRSRWARSVTLCARRRYPQHGLGRRTSIALDGIATAIFRAFCARKVSKRPRRMPKVARAGCL